MQSFILELVIFSFFLICLYKISFKFVLDGLLQLQIKQQKPLLEIKDNILQEEKNLLTLTNLKKEQNHEINNLKPKLLQWKSFLRDKQTRTEIFIAEKNISYQKKLMLQINNFHQNNKTKKIYALILEGSKKYFNSLAAEETKNFFIKSLKELSSLKKKDFDGH